MEKLANGEGVDEVYGGGGAAQFGWDNRVLGCVHTQLLLLAQGRRRGAARWWPLVALLPVRGRGSSQL